MRIGHSLFGGAVAGLVIASGVAACTAGAYAQNEVTRHFAGQATAVAVASGDCRRVAGNYPATLSCKAEASGAASVDFRPLPVAVVGSAQATGTASVEYFAYSFGNANAHMRGAPVRRVKLFPLQAKALAFGEADVQTWQLGYAKPAVGRAFGFGTTYHVGHGLGQGLASGSGAPALELGAAGSGLAPASGLALAAFTIGATGIGDAPAAAMGDAAVTRGGVRELDANGIGAATVTAVAGTVGIHQAQTGRAVAQIVAYPKCQIGGKGRAMASARGDGEGLGTATGATAAPGDTRATAIGAGRYLANGAGIASAKANGTGSGETHQTRVVGKPGNCSAVCIGDGVRVAVGSGKAGSAASITMIVGRRTVTAVPDRVAAKANARSGAASLAVQGKSASANALVQGQGRRRLIGAGFASAEAHAQGANQINDLLPAPKQRTHVVGSAARLIVIGEELRLLAA